MLLTSVSSDISQASMKALSEARGASSSNRPVLRKSASMAFQQAPDEIRFPSKHFQVDQGNDDPLTSHPILQMDADTADHFAHGGRAQPNAHGHVMGSRRRPHVWHGQRDHHLFAVEGGLHCCRSRMHSHK